MPVIGVLAFQGDIEKHTRMILKLGFKVILVKYPEDLAKSDGLIIPGGESTTMGKLLVRFNMLQPIIDRIKSGMAVFGTCAGLILLAKKIEKYDQPGFNLMDITVSRNAYGPQIESFEADILVPLLGDAPVRAVFIRAPIITNVQSNVQILAQYEDIPILVRQDNLLGASFHPELTDDLRVHDYFVKMISTGAAL